MDWTASSGLFEIFRTIFYCQLYGAVKHDWNNKIYRFVKCGFDDSGFGLWEIIWDAALSIELRCLGNYVQHQQSIFSSSFCLVILDQKEDRFKVLGIVTFLCCVHHISKFWSLSLWWMMNFKLPCGTKTYDSLLNEKDVWGRCQINGANIFPTLLPELKDKILVGTTPGQAQMR